MATSFENVAALRKELEGTSDRAAAIVAGAFLDDVLRELLCEFLIKGTEDRRELFEGTGALATFSAKIEMSFRLGLISEEEHRTLTAIRKVRNEFAHMLGDLSFMTQSIHARCKNMEVPLVMVAPLNIPLSQKGERPPLPKIEKATSDNIRAVFQETVVSLMHCLAARVVVAGGNKRISPPNFEAAHEPGEVIVKFFKNLMASYGELIQHENCSPEERGRAQEVQKKHELLIQVQEFCCQQIRRAHAALRG